MDKKIYVYRVEDPDGKGPYADGGRSRWSGGESHATWNPVEGFDRHPGPIEDGFKLFLTKSFGFPSVEAAEAWFEPEAKANLILAGFALRQIPVDSDKVQTGESRKQVVFEKPLNYESHKMRDMWAKQ